MLRIIEQSQSSRNIADVPMMLFLLTDDRQLDFAILFFSVVTTSAKGTEEDFLVIKGLAIDCRAVRVGAVLNEGGVHEVTAKC